MSFWRQYTINICIELEYYYVLDLSLMYFLFALLTSWVALRLVTPVDATQEVALCEGDPMISSILVSGQGSMNTANFIFLDHGVP